MQSPGTDGTRALRAAARHVRARSNPGVHLRDDRVSADHRLLLSRRLGLPHGSPPREQDLLAGACARFRSYGPHGTIRGCAFRPRRLPVCLSCLRRPERAWAFKPELSFIRFAQQAMIVTCIIVPAMLASRNSDLVRGLFLCFAIAAVLNLVFVFIQAADRLQDSRPGAIRDISPARTISANARRSRCCWQFTKSSIPASGACSGSSSPSSPSRSSS